MTNRRRGNLSFCGQYLSLPFPAELRLCVKDSSNCLSVRSKCQLIITTLRASGHIGYIKQGGAEQLHYSPGWLVDRGPVSQGVYEGQRAEEVADAQPRHFPHSESKISLKSLFLQPNPLRMHYLQFFHSFCGRLMTLALCRLYSAQLSKFTGELITGASCGDSFRDAAASPGATRCAVGPHGSLCSSHCFSILTCLGTLL